MVTSLNQKGTIEMGKLKNFEVKREEVIDIFSEKGNYVTSGKTILLITGNSTDTTFEAVVISHLNEGRIGNIESDWDKCCFKEFKGTLEIG